MKKPPAGARTATYIRWHDACSEEAADPLVAVPDFPLAELREVGWLIGESTNSVSIAMELNDDGSPSRWRLHIPKVNIIERRDFQIGGQVAHKRGARANKRGGDGRVDNSVPDRVRGRGARESRSDDTGGNPPST